MANSYLELNDLGREIEDNNEVHGFYEDDRTFGDKMILAVSEITEALDEFRNGRGLGEIYFHVQEDFDVFGLLDSGVAQFNKGDEVDLATYLKLVGDDKKYIAFLKPEGIPIELVDGIIRLLDDLYHMCRVDIGATLYIKMAFNETRPRKHGRVNL